MQPRCPISESLPGKKDAVGSMKGADVLSKRAPIRFAALQKVYCLEQRFPDTCESSRKIRSSLLIARQSPSWDLGCCLVSWWGCDVCVIVCSSWNWNCGPTKGKAILSHGSVQLDVECTPCKTPEYLHTIDHTGDQNSFKLKLLLHVRTPAGPF